MEEEDAVKVCLRVRPLIHREQGEQVNLLWKAENNTISQVDGTRSFHFDRVFHSHETTSQVYQEVAVPIIHSALEGYNGTIFAYGQTSSGKTYTMMGTPVNLGIIPQAVDEIFRIIQEIPNREFLLRVSYMEIYNETVTDLLCDGKKKKPLEIREDINRNVYVADLTEELVMVPEHVLKWIQKGEKNRHYGETKMNDHSSRSHTIFRMIVESRERSDPGNSENCDGAVMVSHLNLVDLAGSERASQTGAEGVRFKEGCNINRSLFILGQVIKKLSDGQVGGFINYRDSKLTRILQNSLGGNTKTVIICTITPVSFDETLSTLQFASTAKHVRNTPHVNEVLDDQALLKRYRKEILDLKKQLEELEASSEIKTHAMAKEEHSQLLAEIKQLQKEREDRISNLTNIVVASSQQVNEDPRGKRKRRVTWAPGKLQDSLCAAGVGTFNIGSKLTANFAKRPKISDFSTILENDDSISTEVSEFEDALRVHVFDFSQDADWNFESKITTRGEKTTALSHSMIDFSSESTSAPTKGVSFQKCEEMEQKVAELEDQLHKLTKEYEAEVGRRESLERETADLRQLQSQEKKDVSPVEVERSSLTEQDQSLPGQNEQNSVSSDHVDITEDQMFLNGDNVHELEELNDSSFKSQIDGVCQDPVQEQLFSPVHDICREQIQMLEQKIADLEATESPEKNNRNDLMESLQICEALMAEKQIAHDELAVIQSNFEQLAAENETLKSEIAYLEKCLQEKDENNEFEMLEKETLKGHENELENKSRLLKDQEKLIAELKKESEILQKKVRYSDLSASMGDTEKLCEEVYRMRQSLSDAEIVTCDAQRESAFLRSENLELKEKMHELSIRCEKREKDASDYEKQLEIEKSNYKKMQADLQKELQYSYNEISQLNGLMAGRVPKDLLSRYELDKKVAEYSKQLASLLDEKTALEQEVASLSAYRSLPSEIELLKDQVQRASEELTLLKSEKEQSASMIMDQKQKLLEQTEQIENLIEEVTRVQATCQQAEQQYSELKMLHESLQESCSLTTEELSKKGREAECLSIEVDNLKQSVESMELKLSAILEEKEELIQAKQELEIRIKELEELLKSSSIENENLQGQVNNVQRASEELTLLKSEKEQSASMIMDQKLLEQTEQIENLIEEVTRVQATCQQAEQQYSELKMLHESLQESCSLTTEELSKKGREAECLLIEVDNLKQSVESMELKLSAILEEKEELIQAKQELETRVKELEDLLKSSSIENENLQGQVNNLSSEATALQQQIERQSELHREKQGLEEKYNALVSEKEQFQVSSPNLAQLASTETSSKLQELQEELKLVVQHRDELLIKVEELKADKDNLKQDLNENIELSIETQDELRTTQEELKQQKQLVADLRKQLADCAGDASPQEEESQRNLEEKLSAMTEKLQENEEKYEALSNEKKELESVHQSLVSELACLQECLTSAEHALSTVEEENKELKQKLEEQLKSVVPDEQMDHGSTVQEDEIREGDLNREVKQEDDVKGLQLEEQMMAVHQEKDALQETLKNITAERDQLKLDLQENIEMSIETQEELRSALDELKVKTQLLESLSTQMNENKMEDNASLNCLEQQTPQCHHEDLVQSNLTLNNELELLKMNLKGGEAELEMLRSEKSDYEQKINHLQVQVELITEESVNLKVVQQSLVSERDQLKEELERNSEKLCCLQEELLKNENVHQELIQRNGELEQGQISLKCELESMAKTFSEAQSTLESLQNEKLEAEQQLGTLQQQMDGLTQERDELMTAKERLTLEITSLKENRMLQNNEENQQGAPENEKAELDNNLKDMEAELASLRNEKSEIEGKLFDLQQHLERMTDERDELKVRVQSLLTERDQLKEDLRENVEMSIETQEDLRKAQEDLQHQKQRVEELIFKTESIEQKSSSVENELQKTTSLLKEANSTREVLEQSKQKLELELEQLHSAIKDKELALGESEKERSEAGHRIAELSVQLKTVSEERDHIQLTQRELQKQFTETQDVLKETQEELQQQKERVEKLTNEISLLVEKYSLIETELQEKIHSLNKAVEDQQNIDQSKEALAAELEQVKEDLRRKASDLEQAKEEKETVSQEILELTSKIKSIAEVRDSLQYSKENLEEEATQLREEIQQLKHERNILADKQMKRTCQLETELQQLQETLHLSDASTKQLEEDNLTLQRQMQQNELDMASLRQEQEQFQQLLQRARSEKENIYASLQDQEKAVAQLQEELITSQAKLQAVQKECDESNAHLIEKVNEANRMLAEISSLKDQMQQLHQEIKDEKMKNYDLCEKVDHLEEETRALRLIQSEPAQKEDELAECAKIVEQKSKEWKDLMVNISTVYLDHHSLLVDFISDLQSKTAAQKESMSAIKETLSPPLSRAFESKLTEHSKLNSQKQVLLNKFKIIYSTAAVKEEYYGMAKDLESDLCAVQKKNDELMLQCESLEQHGRKWSEDAAEELKLRELEFIKQLITRKVELMKHFEADFAEAQLALKSVEPDLTEEIKCKKEFGVWLEQFKGSSCDAQKLSDGVHQENRRIAGVIQQLTKKLKMILQSKIKQETMKYLKSLELELHEKKEKNKELLQRLQQIAPPVVSDLLEEENAQLRETLKKVQEELQKMKSRMRELENELSSAKADARRKEQKAALLEDKLRSSTAESQLSEMQIKLSEKEKDIQAALKEIQILQEKVTKGAAPYKEEIESLKDQVVRVQMARMKLSKSTDQQIVSLKSSLDESQTYIQKLKEKLRRAQKDMDTTVCSESSSTPQYPLTCGGGSGIVQSTAMLVLQSENATLKREIEQYKKKCEQLSRNISSHEDELKKFKDGSKACYTTPPSSSHHDEGMSHSKTDSYKTIAASPKKEMPVHRIASPGKTGMHGKCPSQNKTEKAKYHPMSPSKTERHSVPIMSPGNTGFSRRHPASPVKTGPLFSALIPSPSKKQAMAEKEYLPKDQFFDGRSKSLPYCPSQFFDNTSLGTLPGTDLGGTATASDVYNWWDRKTEKPNENTDLYGATTGSGINSWWDQAGKTENPNDCKTS
ncbi:centromere-associated protein E isoform X2 [Dendropsophus ebraccatus]|uniref:centromere-associated protein E isoform X2 n=1 Tax=Dendropsophus ebraccatus TaxID=150705 RepID=UPI003831B8D6